MTLRMRLWWKRQPRLMRSAVPAVIAAGLALASSYTASAAPPETPAGPAAPPDAADFGFEQVQAIARELASVPFDDHAIHLEDWLTQFDYDDYREIEYRREKALWYDTDRPFHVQFFHRGGIFPNPVQVHVVREGQPQPFPFSTDLFNYRALKIEGQVPPRLGFAGFKVLAPLNDPDRFDEVLSFLGSSYFRALGESSVYGLSARGLAVNPSKFGHEEFPWFRAFWIEESSSSDHSLRVYALLDSQSVTGAYQFDLKPGDPTVIGVEVVLYPRKDIAELGVAPLTSMYLYGEAGPPPPTPDFRPEVHDSDGLLIHTAAGEYIWRPLRNPDQTTVTRFPLDDPRGFEGFGLLQRDRDFGHYQDLEAVYQKRPSAWIEPTHGFGAGTVSLIEIASDSEAIDSIVAYWTPAAPVRAGQELRLGYRMSWGNSFTGCPTGGQTVATRIGAGEDGAIRYIIDFAGPALAALPPDAHVTGHVSATGGTVGPAVVQYNPFNQTWRLFFDMTPTPGAPDAATPAPDAPGDTGVDRDPLRMRAFLRHGDDAVSETWSYRWSR